jgi:hypothetical protein
LFLGLGAFGISNVLKNIREASGITALAQGANATNATGASAAPPSNNLDIRPFHVNFPEAELTELRRRINATRWPERETVTDPTPLAPAAEPRWGQGVQLATIQKLARYWATDYDWRKVEAKLKALP